MSAADTTPAAAERMTVPLGDGSTTPVLLQSPAGAHAALVLAHGAGAGMEHHFMADLAAALATQGVATLRFQFPFMARGSRRVDPPAVAQATVRSAVREAADRWPGLPLFAGGKSYGGRMASQAQAAAPMPGVRGLVFAGFPLHPAGQPGVARADHLAAVDVPMLFLQGTRDALAELHLVRGTCDRLGRRAHLHVVDGADHGFDVLVRSGRTAAQVVAELAREAAAWIGAQARAEA
jgi:hypothetical protein